MRTSLNKDSIIIIITKQHSNNRIRAVYKWDSEKRLKTYLNLYPITKTSPYSFGNFRKLSLYNCFMPI